MTYKIVVIYKLFDHDALQQIKDCFVVCSKNPLVDEIGQIKLMIQNKEKSRLVGYQFVCGTKCFHEHELPIENDLDKTKIPQMASMTEMKKFIFRYDKGQSPCSHAKEQSYDCVTGVHDRLDYVDGQLIVKKDLHLFGQETKISQPVKRGRGRSNLPLKPIPAPLPLSMPSSSADQMVLSPSELAVINGVKPRATTQTGGDYAATRVLVDRILKSALYNGSSNKTKLEEDAQQLFENDKLTAREYSIMMALIGASFK